MSSPIFIEALEIVHKANPTAETAYLMVIYLYLTTIR